MDLYYYLLVLGIIGGIVGAREPKQSLKAFFIRLIDGCFSAFIAYEIAFYYLNNERISLAICGIGAWLGMENIINFLRELLKKDKR